MRTSIISSVVSGFIALSMAACSGASTEPADQSAQAEQAGLATPAGSTTPVASNSAAPAAPGAEHHMHRRGWADPAQLVKRFDKNGDGVLQVSELSEHMQKFMGAADTNNDGVLSVDELKAGEEKMKAEHLAKVDTDHDGKISPEERKAAFQKFEAQRFAKMDKNGDGALTKEEVGDKRWQHLSVADADKSGSVTQAEIQAAIASGALKFPHHGHGFHGGPDGENGQGNAPPAASTPAATGT